MSDAITIETLMAKIREQVRQLEHLPAGVVVAPDVWGELRASTTFNHGLERINNYSGLPFEMSVGLARGEWFTHDLAGFVMQYNGNYNRICIIAKARRLQRRCA